MRGLIAVCVGLVMVLGAGAAWAGAFGACILPDGSCGAYSPADCEMRDGDFRGFNTLCCQKLMVAEPELCATTGECPIGQVCGVPPEDFATDGGGAGAVLCGCLPVDSAPAPTASPYGIAALLIALGGFGAWRLRKRAAA